MMIRTRERGNASIKDHLSQKYWEGYRWLAAESESIWMDDRKLHFFREYQSAADFCKQQEFQGQQRCIMVLGDLLKKMIHGNQQKFTDAETNGLRELLTRFPISFNVPIENALISLLEGNYFPVFWKAVIHPLSAIQQYQVIEGRPGNMASKRNKLSGNILYSYNSFNKAMASFNIVVNEKSIRTGRLVDLYLIGRLNENSGHFNKWEAYHRTDLLLYRARPILVPDQDRLSYQVFQEHDITRSLINSKVIVVRYNIASSQLSFFNGSLKRIKPGLSTDDVDLKYFAFQYY